MAGSITSKDKLRLLNIVEKGYYSTKKEYDSVFNLIGINQFMPSDKQFIKEVFDRYYKYYPNEFKNNMELCNDK
jgi:hypothetical protein